MAGSASCSKVRAGHDTINAGTGLASCLSPLTAHEITLVPFSLVCSRNSWFLDLNWTNHHRAHPTMLLWSPWSLRQMARTPGGRWDA